MSTHLRTSTERVSRIPLKSGPLSFGRETRSHWCWLEGRKGRKGPPGIACKFVQHPVGTTRLFLFKQDSQGYSLSPSLYHFLSSFCLCSLLLRFPPSSLRFTYLHYLVGFVTDVFLVGRFVLRCSGMAASWFYWVFTCCLVERSVVGVLVLVARALGLDS